MTRINLLPPEIIQRQRARRQTAAVAAVGLLVIVLLAGFYVLQQIKLSGVQKDLTAQRERNADLQAQVNELKRFDEIVGQINQKEQLLATLLANEVRWSGVMRDLSLVIPGNAWLTALTATVTDPVTNALAPVTVTNPDIVGNITFEGTADRHPTVAEWLTALEKIRGFLNPWVTQSAAVQLGPNAAFVHFTSSVDLTKDVTVEGRSES
jgi:Tfp pilus assembly protein PilN